MSATEYKSIVESIGSITDVARKLGVARETVSRRCSGVQEITEEAALAITALGQRPTRRSTEPLPAAKF